MCKSIIGNVLCESALAAPCPGKCLPTVIILYFSYSFITTFAAAITSSGLFENALSPIIGLS